MAEHTKPLSEQATEWLINYIIANDLQAGDKLPNEFELAQLCGVGRSTLREAVKQLVSRNVLEVRQGAGTFVTGEQMGVSDDPLGLTFIRDKRKLVMDLLEIRMVLEPRIAAMAAANATEEDIAKIRRLADEVEQKIYAGEDHMQKDIDFHAAISESSKNLVVPNLTPIIQHAISLFVNITNRKLGKETIESHRAVVEAIEQHDAMAASDAMTLHLIHNRNNLKKLFCEQQEAEQAQKNN